MKKVLLLVATAMMSFAVSAQTIFSEDFSNVNTPSGIGSVPTGWTTYGDNLTNANNSYTFLTSINQSWSIVNFSDAGKTAVSVSNTSQGTACDRWMITPAITLPAGNSYALEFLSFAVEPSDALKLMVSTTTTDKSSFTELTDIHPTQNDVIYSQNLTEYAGQTIYIAFVNHGTGTFVCVDDISVVYLYDDAIALEDISSPHYAAIGATNNVSVTVKNTGANTLTSFDYEYTVNGNELSGSESGLNIAHNGTYTFTIPVTVNTAEIVNVNVTLTNPNGVDDPDMTDNTASVAYSSYDPSMTVARTALLEHFTTGKCPNCPPAHTNIHNVMNSNCDLGGKYSDHVIWVAHHCGYYTDPMTISESEELQVFYNDGDGTYAPATMVDRNYDVAQTYDANPGPIFFPSNIKSNFDAALAVPAFVTCQLSNLTYDENSRSLSVTVSGNFSADMVFDSPRLNLFLIEDSIIGAQSGAGSQSNKYKHDHVIRHMFSAVWGDSDAFTTTNDADSYTKTYTYTLPSNIRAHRARLVAFVSNYNANDVNKRDVKNACQSDFLIDHKDPTTTGITAVEASVNVTTYPNPAAEMAYVNAESTIRSYEMVNAMGQKVMAQENVNADVLELNVSNLETGVYFITVTTDKGVATQKLNVVR